MKLFLGQCWMKLSSADLKWSFFLSLEVVDFSQSDAESFSLSDTENFSRSNAKTFPTDNTGTLFPVDTETFSTSDIEKMFLGAAEKLFIGNNFADNQSWLFLRFRYMLDVFPCFLLVEPTTNSASC